jgi:hypothetical protein
MKEESIADDKQRIDYGKIIDDRADWLIDGVATATQDRRFLRGDPQADTVLIDAIMMNGAKAIRIALQKSLGVEIAPSKIEVNGS